MIAWIWFALATLFSYVQQGQTALSSPAPPPPPVTYQNVSLASFPVRVYGLEDLAPPVNGTVPPVTVAIYMHGRFESADIADPLVRSLYASTRQHMVADPAGSLRDFLLVSFDALNHGARTRDPARRFDLPQNPTFLYVWLNTNFFQDRPLRLHSKQSRYGLVYHRLSSCVSIPER